MKALASSSADRPASLRISVIDHFCQRGIVCLLSRLLEVMLDNSPSGLEGGRIALEVDSRVYRNNCRALSAPEKQPPTAPNRLTRPPCLRSDRTECTPVILE